MTSKHVSKKCKICNTRNAVKGSAKCYKCSTKGQKYATYQREKKTRGYRKYLKDKCEKCGFIPVHKCQLDVDHIDGNKKNNDPTNLATLCANCHRLKTMESKDFFALPWRVRRSTPGSTTN